MSTQIEPTLLARAKELLALSTAMSTQPASVFTEVTLLQEPRVEYGHGQNGHDPGRLADPTTNHGFVPPTRTRLVWRFRRCEWEEMDNPGHLPGTLYRMKKSPTFEEWEEVVNSGHPLGISRNTRLMYTFYLPPREQTISHHPNSTGQVPRFRPRIEVLPCPTTSDQRGEGTIDGHQAEAIDMTLPK